MFPAARKVVLCPIFRRSGRQASSGKEEQGLYKAGSRERKKDVNDDKHFDYYYMYYYQNIENQYSEHKIILK